MKTLEEKAFLIMVRRMDLTKHYLTQDWKGRHDLRVRIENSYNYKFLVMELALRELWKTIKSIWK